MRHHEGYRISKPLVFLLLAAFSDQLFSVTGHSLFFFQCSKIVSFQRPLYSCVSLDLRTSKLLASKFHALPPPALRAICERASGDLVVFHRGSDESLQIYNSSVCKVHIFLSHLGYSYATSSKHQGYYASSLDASLALVFAQSENQRVRKPTRDFSAFSIQSRFSLFYPILLQGGSRRGGRSVKKRTRTRHYERYRISIIFLFFEPSVFYVFNLGPYQR